LEFLASLLVLQWSLCAGVTMVQERISINLNGIRPLHNQCQLKQVWRPCQMVQLCNNQFSQHNQCLHKQVWRRCRTMQQRNNISSQNNLCSRPNQRKLPPQLLQYSLQQFLYRHQWLPHHHRLLPQHPLRLHSQQQLLITLVCHLVVPMISQPDKLSTLKQMECDGK
jgi:hypothetical protein